MSGVAGCVLGGPAADVIMETDNMAKAFVPYKVEDLLFSAGARCRCGAASFGSPFEIRTYPQLPTQQDPLATAHNASTGARKW